MYMMYENYLISHLGTGLSLQADNPRDVLNQLEGESFTIKYYVINSPAGIIDIKSKEELKKWFLKETGE